MKDDIKQVNDVAQEFGMSRVQRKEFGDFLEGKKRQHLGGTQNKSGDFTYKELQQQAELFMES